MKYRLIIFSLLFCASVVAQQTDYVDFTLAKAFVKFDTIEKSVEGTVRYQFSTLKNVDSVFIDAKSVTIVKPLILVHLPTKEIDSIDFNNDASKVWVKHKFKANNEYELIMNYKTTPKKALYFVGWDNNAPNQIWTQGQGQYTSNWLPSFDDMNEKLKFHLIIQFDSNYEVLANGKLFLKTNNEDGKTDHVYLMSRPMSSYLVALAIGKYNKKVETSNSGIPLEMYYYPEDSLKVEPTYRYTKDMFDFLENEIGVPYPWQNYKQVPVHDFLYAGMENTSLTIFSDAFMVDSIGFNDRNYVNVNAHELAHQWFGDMITETSGTHHWLQEGFATYYALLAERDVFGKNYYYWRLYEYAQELLEQDSRDEGTALLNPKSSSTTFYKKGAWVLHILREKIGDDAFREAVKDYLVKHQFKNVETSDFIDAVELASGQNLQEFVAKWLEDTIFPYNEAMASLEQSVFIQEYLMADCEANNGKCAYYMSAPLSAEAKSKIISQVPDRVTADVFKDGLKVRQAIAQSVSKIPLNIKNDYESLLQDASYLTIEAALYNLWVNFPNERGNYLDQTKSIIGLNDKNVRQLWLVLTLSTPEYQESQKGTYFEELVSYTSADYGFEVRQSAFSYLQALDVFPDASLKNLIDASKHFNWRFKSFAKDLLEQLSNSDRYADKIEQLQTQK